MTLLAKVQLRFSAKRLTEVTRPEQASYSTPDTTFLEDLCDDVEAYFLAESVGTYDDDDASHVAVACDGVVALGQYRIAASDGNERRWENWLKRLRNLALVNRNDRVQPVASGDQPRRFSDEQAHDVIGGRGGLHRDDDSENEDSDD